MVELPQDILVDILSRLPVKSLLRCKCVRKPWNSLISSPQFVETHLKRSMESDTMNNRQRALLTSFPLKSIDYESYGDGDDSSDVTMELNYPRDSTPIFESKIVGSCDGLVCLLIDNDSLVLWNPSTRVSMELPRGSPYVGLYVFYGIGYDSSTHDYKVLRGIRVYSTDASETNKVEVIGLKNNTWRMIDIQNPNISLNGSGKYLNGALHWLVKKETGEFVIASFNLADEKLEEELELPDCFCQDINWTGLGISGNHLFVYGICNGNLFEAWVMEEYGVVSSWFKLHSFPLDKLPSEEDGHALLCFTKSDKLLISVGGWSLIRYDPNDDKIERLFVENVPYNFDAVTYIESLVSLNVGGGANQ